MYKNYELLVIDTTEKMIVIKFMKEGFTDYVTRRYYLSDELDDAELMRQIEHAQTEAFEFHKKDVTSVPFTPIEGFTGTLRDIEMGPIPEYNTAFETLTEEWVETETKRTRILKVVPLSAEDKAIQTITKRADLLAGSDSAALSDRSMSKEMRDYRQALRDITDQAGFPDNIVWPIAPLG